LNSGNSAVENLIFNQIRVYVEDNDKEAVRLEVINKPGDTLQNSAQLIITLTKTGKLYISIKRDKLDKKQIPFYLLFRALGITRDEDIFNNIVFKQTGAVQEKINTILLKAYEVSYDEFPDAINHRDRIEVIKYVAGCINKDVFPYIDMKTEDGERQAVNFVNNTLNKYFEPHISTEGEHEDKAFYLGMLIHYMLGSYIGIYSSTDRDSCRCKRMHAPGITLAKSIKQFFNTSIIQGIYTAFKNTFKAAPFDRVNLENTFNRITGTDFEQQMAKIITSGNKANIRVRNGRNVMNRLVSQQHGHKNPLDAVARMRQLTAPNTSNESAKTSERATSMRKVHATYPGYICLIHTPEGEKVGITKQSAIYMKITESGNSDILKEFIMGSPDDPKIREAIPDMKINFTNKRSLDTRAIVENDVCLVYVNGDFIGCTNDSHKFANNFRRLRRLKSGRA
jgi:DNA-directed RNA polymerase beta subunit